MYKILIILCFLGCGRQESEDFTVDTRLQSMWQQYTQTLELSGIDWGTAVSRANFVSVSVESVDKMEGRAGICITESERIFNKVRYIKRIKMAEDRLQDWSTFYHELGHCLFNLKHVEDPNSIMYFSTEYSDYWTNNEKSTAIRLYIKAIKGE